MVILLLFHSLILRFNTQEYYFILLLFFLSDMGVANVNLLLGIMWV